MLNIIQKSSKIFALLLVSLLFATVSFDASAQQNNNTTTQKKVEESKITEVICNAIEQLTGPIGRAIAVLIIISLAIALFLGKVTWGLAIAVAVGLGILFGASNVVGLLTGVQGSEICPDIKKT